SGEFNTAIGTNALYTSNGYGNTAIGNATLFENETGNYNTAAGMWSMYENINGNYNTAHGVSAGDWRTNITYGTFVGADAYASANSLTNVAGYGYNARPTASNQVRIGNSSVSSIGGWAGWTNLWDSRYSRNIEDDVVGLEFITKLRPVTYQLDVHGLANELDEDCRRDADGNSYIDTPGIKDQQGRSEKSTIRYSGFVAEEVERAARESGFDFSGVDVPKNDSDFYGLRYAEFVVPLVKAVQEQQEIIDRQQRQIDELLHRIMILESRGN
ncbi:MAG: tail fiber domain-containing protein, partial [Candidatus Cloacimonetes bacterium]|nr:tail fiber domain-containing protein [Candidatus Cloacimonadota bacterium]